MQNKIGRHPERARTDRALLDELLDSLNWGTLATVFEGQPWAVPILYARDGDRLLFHGSTGAGALRHVAAGAPIVFTVATVDALVVGHTTFASSADYRSATLRGVPRPVVGDAKVAALNAFSETIFPGRVAEVRPMNAKELAATSVLELPIEDGSWLFKMRDIGASEPDEQTDAWGGTIPYVTTLGQPRRAAWCSAELPASVKNLLS